MTPAEAIRRCRERWASPPVDPRDVEERIALRFRDAETPPETLVIAHDHAPRLFVRHGDGWRSAYVHATADVDATLDRLVSP